MFVIDYEKALPKPDYATLANCSKVTIKQARKPHTMARWAREHCKSYTWMDSDMSQSYQEGIWFIVDFYFWDPADALLFQIKYKTD
jgi:hypothetical protein